MYTLLYILFVTGGIAGCIYIYLQSETAAYPELRLVAVMHNDKLSYAPGFDEALKGLLQEGDTGPVSEGVGFTGTENIEELIKKASEAFNNYLREMNNKNFNSAGNALEELQRSLEKLTEKTNKEE
jgi:uncharacterized membrane protein (UPF0182 family)